MSETRLDVPTALNAIQDVTNWRSLGTHLGIKSSKLDEIAKFPIKEQKSQIVVAWFACDEAPSLEKLQTALKKPSVGEIRAAERVSDMRRVSLTSGPSFDTSVSKDSPLKTDEGNCESIL